LFKMCDTRIIVAMFSSGHSCDPLAFVGFRDEDGRKFVCTVEALPQYELYAKQCLIPICIGHALPVTTKIQIVGHSEVERIKTSKPEALSLLAKAVSKVMFEATGHDPTKASTLSDGMLLNALNCMKLIAVNMSMEVVRLLQEQHERAKADPSNDEIKALIARIDPLYRILDFVAEEIGHLIGIASFLVASAPSLSAKITAKIRLEVLVVAKKLRTRLLQGRAGNWPIPRTIDPHAMSLNGDVADLRLLIREGFDELNRKTVAAVSVRNTKQVAPPEEEDRSDDEVPRQKKAKVASAAPSSAASSSSQSSDKLSRDKSMQPLAQLENMKSAGFKSVMFELCPSVIKDVPCKMAAGKCHFWHLCAACVKGGVDLATCLTRRHCDHKLH